MALTITRNLDVSPGAVPACVHVKQYASDFTLRFVLYSSEGTFTMEGDTSCFLRGTKKDGKGFQLGGNRSGSTVTFSGTHAQMQQMTAVAGDNLYEVVLKHEDKELPCGSFILRTQAAAMDAETVTDPSSIEELESQIVETTTVEYGGDNVTVENGVLIIS